MEKSEVDQIDAGAINAVESEAPVSPVPLSPSDSNIGNKSVDSTSLGANGMSSTTEEASNGSQGLEESDAGPFNIAGYRKHLPGSDNNRHLEPLETFTDKDSHSYDLAHGTRLAIVFNHKNYLGNRACVRNGTDEDCKAIAETFGQLGFVIEIHTDLKMSEIQSVLFQLQTRNNLSCLALFILTHGEADGLMYSYDTNYKLNKHIISELLPYNCKSLAGKPKMLFIQACQGQEADGGVHLTPTVGRCRHTSTDGAGDTTSAYCIPNYADFLIFNASYHGHFSFRSGSGSWFVQALCKEVKDSKVEEDLLTVLTRVSRHVALNKKSNVPDPRLAYMLNNKKQIPLRQDTLIRNIYLKKHVQMNNGIEVPQSSSQEKHQPEARSNKLKSFPNRPKKDEKCLCM